MSDPVVNFILFHSDQRVTMPQVAEALGSLPGVEVAIIGPSKIVVREDGWPFTVYYATVPHVLAESHEMAQSHAAGRPDEEFIATCDRRFEVSWIPDPQMKHFNTWLFVTHKVEALVNGVTLDAAGTLDEPKLHRIRWADHQSCNPLGPR
jgi:hypothetical protein